MFLGRFVEGDKVWVPICIHKFETGESLAGTVEGYYILIGDSLENTEEIEFSQFNEETGIYYAEIDTTDFDEGAYLVIVKATVDTVECAGAFTFEVREVYGRYAPD